MLSALETVGAWLRAIPGPTPEWAAILGDWAWPIVILVVICWLHQPLSGVLNTLAKRVEKDNFRLAGLIDISSADTTYIPLDPAAAAEAEGAFDAEFHPVDVKNIEMLLEYIGESSENFATFLHWVEQNVDPELDPKDFLGEPVFALDRQKAYDELVRGKGNNDG